MGDIDRSYYVYMHRDNESERPFYIGKGKGRRAYSTDGRSHAWREKVAVLTQGYSIVFVKENLTEIEAELEEEKWIKELGCIADGRGPLVNEPSNENVIFGGVITGPWASTGYGEDEFEEEPEVYAHVDKSVKAEFVLRLDEAVKMIRKDLQKMRRELAQQEGANSNESTAVFDQCIWALKDVAKGYLVGDYSFDDVAGEVEGQLEEIRNAGAFGGMVSELCAAGGDEAFLALCKRSAQRLQEWVSELQERVRRV